MGLTIHYDLSLAADASEADVSKLLVELREMALRLPFGATSNLVRLTEQDLARPWPLRGLTFERLEDVVDVTARFVRDELYRELLGLDVDGMPDDEYFRVEAPEGLPVVVIGFAVAPGAGSEPASFALAKLGSAGTHERPGRWMWHCGCKTQYASVHGDESFLKCHTSVIALLDAATRLGLACDVRDESGYYDSRDESELLASVGHWNRLIARFAGRFSDAIADAGGDTSRVQGEIFRHPDFERLEMSDE